MRIAPAHRRIMTGAAGATLLLATLVVGSGTPAEAAGDPIVFAGSMEGMSREIWSVHPDGSNLRQLTDDQRLDDTPALSPDGSRIAFLSDPFGDVGLYVMDIDGSDRRRVTQSYDSRPSWSPDGARIVVSRLNDQGGTDLHVVDVATGTSTPLVADATSPDWAPDGSEIAYVRGSGGPPELRAIAPDGSGDRAIVSPGDAPDWSPDSSALVYSSGQNVEIIGRDGSGGRTILENANDPAWSPDAMRIVAVRQSCSPPPEGDGQCENSLVTVHAGGIDEQVVTDGWRATGLVPDWGAYGDAPTDGGADDGGPNQGGASADTQRYAGPTRFSTAVAISRAQFQQAATVYLARGVDPLVDAVAGGSLTGGPTLLVPPCGELPEEVVQELQRLQPGNIFALGGSGAICDQVLDDAAAAAGGATADRLAGPTRFSTAVAISQLQFDGTINEAYLARGIDPLVDAVAGGTLSRGPILLVPPCGDVPQEVLDELARLSPGTLVALGGAGAICDQVFQDAADAAGADSMTRFAGATRFSTAVAISEVQFPGGAGTVHLARGFDPLVDAVAGGSLTAGPILLVPPCGDIPAEVTNEIARLAPDTVVALGGSGAICDQVLTDAADAAA